MARVESIQEILPRVLIGIREKILDEEFTPERSLQVDQIDELLDKW
jgi:hypothetical protein